MYLGCLDLYFGHLDLCLGVLTYILGAWTCRFDVWTCILGAQGFHLWNNICICLGKPQKGPVMPH